MQCKNCGWVHYKVSRKHAEEQVKEFNKYYDKLSKEKQDEFYGGKPASIELYENCHRCGGNYKNFTEELTFDAFGSTIGPIIDKDE